MRLYIISTFFLCFSVFFNLKGQTVKDSVSWMVKQIETKDALEQWDSCWFYLNQYYDYLDRQKNLSRLRGLMVEMTDRYLPNSYLPKKNQQDFVTLQLGSAQRYLNQEKKAIAINCLTKFYFFEQNRQRDSAVYYLLELNKLVDDNKDYSLGLKANSYKALNTFLLGNRELSLDYLLKAEEQAAFLPVDSSALTPLYQTQGYIYGELMQEEKALKAISQSIAIQLNKTSFDSLLLASQYNNLATVYGSLEDYDFAAYYLEKAIELSPNVPSEYFNIAQYYHNLGMTQDYINIDNTLSIDNMSKSIQFLDKLNVQNESIAQLYIDNYQAMAGCYIDDEAWEAAKDVLENCNRLHQKYTYSRGYTYFLKGQYLYEQGNWEEAKNYANKAQEQMQKDDSQKHFFRVKPLLLLGKIANAKGDYKKALDWYQEALKEPSVGFDSDNIFDNPSIEQMADPIMVFGVLQYKVEAFLDYAEQQELKVEEWKLLNEYILATVELEESIRESFSNEYRQRFLFQKSASIYESAIQSAVSLYKLTKDINYLHKTFELSEKSKAVVLQQSLQEHKAKTFGGVPDSLIIQESKLQKHINYYKQQLLSVVSIGDSLATRLCKEQIIRNEDLLQEIKHQLRTNYPKYYELKYLSRLVSVGEIQGVLDDSTCLVEYFWGKEQLYTFGITKDSFWFSQQIAIAPLKSKITELLKGIENYQEMGAWLSNSYELYAKLIAPNRKEGIKRLYIIPDNILYHIPFEVLLCKETTPSAKFSNLDYLLRYYAISYNYSAKLWLDQLQNVEPPNYEIMAMAADYSLEADSTRALEQYHLRQRLSQLPEAAQELSLLEERYDGLFYADRYASEYYLKKYIKSYGIAHLTMYAMVDNYYPEYASLVFSEDGYEGEDNFLYAYEIKQMNLQHLAMLVLSTFESGSGQYQTGEGVLSLGRNFVFAGLPSIVMTLWKLNDKTSPQIIRRFYDNLQEGMAKDEALRQAKLSFLGEATGIATHPALWASYVHFGNYENIRIEEPINKIWWFIIPILAMGLIGWWGLRGLRQRRRL